MWYWFGLAALALIVELSTGTFYLLLVTFGLIGAGLSAALGASLSWQLVCFTLVALTGLWGLRRFSVLRRRHGDPARDAAVNMDIGHIVLVDAWGPQRNARVMYRGAQWDAVPASSSQVLHGGPHRIVGLDGTFLILAPA